MKLFADICVEQCDKGTERVSQKDHIRSPLI